MMADRQLRRPAAPAELERVAAAAVAGDQALAKARARYAAGEAGLFLAATDLFERLTGQPR